jgi:hypothetical protein
VSVFVSACVSYLYPYCVFLSQYVKVQILLLLSGSAAIPRNIVGNDVIQVEAMLRLVCALLHASRLHVIVPVLDPLCVCHLIYEHQDYGLISQR